MVNLLKYAPNVEKREQTTELKQPYLQIKMEHNGTISTQKRKEIFIEAFKFKNNITQACKVANIGRTTFYNWIKQKAFQEKLNQAVESLKDQIENKLIEKALKGDNACLIFFCKTKMKDRGYVEKQEIESKIEIKTDMAKLRQAIKDGVPFQ